MYYYVYDEFVQDPKFERELSQIETRLTDLGISGKIARLALFRDATELIKDEVRKGAKNIVAVGNDLTLRKVIDAAADSGVAMGIIPLGNQGNFIADMIGVPNGFPACDVLSARIIEDLDTGIVNSRRFINRLEFQTAGNVEILCDQSFTLSPKRKASIEIRNLALADESVRAANPTDGKLEIVVRAQGRSWFGRKRTQSSIVPVEEARIRISAPSQIFVDGESFEAEELKVRVLPKHLKLITGKQRKF